MKIYGKSITGQIKSIKMHERIDITISMPITEMITAAWHDWANRKEKKTMEDFCKDVAELLKTNYGFKILKVDQHRTDASGNLITTEGEPSSTQGTSLSLYYFIRVDLAKFDLSGYDGLQYSEMKAIVDCDLNIRITDHPFTANGLKGTYNYLKDGLNKLAEQEKGEPDYKEVFQDQIEISNLITQDYKAGLAEVDQAVHDEIGEWRKSFYNAIKRQLTRKG